MVKKMNTFNYISAVSFFLSSASILFIPALDLSSGLTASAYVVAALFWIGLLCGLGLQILLTVNCKKLKLKSSGKKQRIPLAMFLLFFVVLIFLIICSTKNKALLSVCLFCTLISLQASIIIRRKGFLK
ncbi:MAG: hypothetical protein IIZ46_02535 [Clostridia bacterium]|nr:hypothetical protein [Clostridia bacterium]